MNVPHRSLTVCSGLAHDSRPASARIAVEGTLLTTHTDSVGSFKLEVPALQVFTVDAQRDTFAAAATSRPAVAVQPGETLDLGTLDVGACPPPALGPIVDQDDRPVPAPPATRGAADYTSRTEGDTCPRFGGVY